MTKAEIRKTIKLLNKKYDVNSKEYEEKNKILAKINLQDMKEIGIFLREQEKTLALLKRRRILMTKEEYINTVKEHFINGDLDLNTAIEELADFGLVYADCEKIFGKEYMERWYDGEDDIYYQVDLNVYYTVNQDPNKPM